MMPSHKALRPFSAHFPNFFTSNSITPDHTLHTFPHHTCHMCVHIFIFSLQISSHLFLHLGKFYSTSILCREGNGTSLQYSCLENAIDGGASQVIKLIFGTAGIGILTTWLWSPCSNILLGSFGNVDPILQKW